MHLRVFIIDISTVPIDNPEEFSSEEIQKKLMNHHPKKLKKIIVEPSMPDHPIIPGLQFLFICKDESMFQEPKNGVKNSNDHTAGTILKDCYFRCKQKKIILICYCIRDIE